MDTSEQLFAQLVREHKSTIYTVCYMFSKDNDEVSDLFQEILVKLWKGFGSFEGRSDIKTWVIRVCINTCITMDRKRKSRPQTNSIDETCRNIISEESADPTLHEARLKELYSRIQQLSVFDRAIILLWLEGMPYDEIGEIVGITAKNVSVRLVRIREALKKMSGNTTE